MAGSRFTTKERGEQFAMISGASILPVLCAVSSDSLVPYRLLAVRHMVRVWILPGLMMSIAREERPLYLIVPIVNGEKRTVDITKMQVLCVTLK